MNKLLCLLIIIFVLCANANAETYYVDAVNGNDGSTGTSESEAWKTLEKINESDFASGDTIKLSGLFTGESLDLSEKTGVTVMNWADREQAVVDGTGLIDTDTCSLFGTSCSLNGLIFQSAVSGRQNIYIRGDGNNVENCIFRNPSAGAVNVKFGGDGLTRFENNVVEGGGGGKDIIQMSNNASVKLNYNIIYSTDVNATSDSVLIKVSGTGGTLNICNNIMFGGRGGIILHDNIKRTTNVFNNIIGPANIEHPYNAYLIKSYGIEASINADYNLLIPNASQQEGEMLNYLLGDYVTDGGHNIIDTPYFVEYPYYGYLIIAVDDSDYKYAEELADLAASYGSKITWFVNHRTTYEHGHEPLEEGITEREAAIARLASDGHDIGCHGWSHSKLDDYKAMRIKYNRSGGCALTIDNGTLMLDAEEDRYDLNMNISDKTCQDIIDSVKSVDDGYGYNISMVVFDGDVQQFGHAQATSLADVASQSITSEYTMLFNFDRWKVDEIDDTNSWIESINSMPDGYRVATFAAPYNAYDTDWLSYIRTIFVAARSGGSLYYSTKTKSIDLHEIGFLESTILKGAAGTYDDDQIRARGRWLGERLSMHGGVICMFSHNSKETSITEWSIILDEIVNNYPKVNLVSLRQFHDIVTTLDSGWTKDGNAWTKEIEADYDFHLKPESPCIDAGTDVGLGHDITGCPIPQDGNVDIGAYEYCAQIPEDTTTTTTSYPSCPVAFLLDNDEGSIDLARKFKTDVFLKTPEGKKLVKLYYKHAPELIQILINTPAVYAIATDLLKIMFPKAGDNKSIIINGKIHIKLVELCDAAANHASEGLRKDIMKIKRDIEDGSIFTRLGISTAPLSSGHYFETGGKTFRFRGALGFMLSAGVCPVEPVRRLKSDSENLLDELESFDAQFTAAVTASWFSEEMNE